MNPLKVSFQILFNPGVFPIYVSPSLLFTQNGLPKRAKEISLPRSRAKFHRLNLGPVCLIGLFLQGSSELLVRKAQSAAVGMVDNGNFFKLD